MGYKGKEMCVCKSLSHWFHLLAACVCEPLLNFSILQGYHVVFVLLGLDRRGRIMRVYLDMFSKSQQHNRWLWYRVLAVSDKTVIVTGAPLKEFNMAIDRNQNCIITMQKYKSQNSSPAPLYWHWIYVLFEIKPSKKKERKKNLLFTMQKRQYKRLWNSRLIKFCKIDCWKW